MSGASRDHTLLEARLADAIAKCERGTPACLAFLTPGECRFAERTLRHRACFESAWFWGGYADAERKCLFLLPEYLLLCLSEPIGQVAVEELLELLGEVAEQEICALRIRGSGFRSLNHRDYLGSIMGLGLERDAIGDIAVQNEHEAILFASQTIARFLIEHLNKVATDSVRCELCKIDEKFTDGRTYQPIYDTVASPRLDCVVAALTNLSREQAQNTVRSGLVEVDYEVADQTDLILTPPQTLSVRGYGRFILRSFDGETRKGRLRLRADRLV